jgi:hypothetical protein
MSDRDINSWDQRLKDQSLRRWHNYTRQRIALDDAGNGECFYIAGEFLYVEEVSSESARAAIALNLNTNDQLDLMAGVVLRTVFNQFYVWNEAQAGEWIDVVVGINFEYYKRWAGQIVASEAQPAVIITNATPGINTLGPNLPCNRVLMRAHTTNATTVWVNFSDPAIAGGCFELTPGDAISVPLGNTNLINVLFTTGGDDLTVIYEA